MDLRISQESGQALLIAIFIGLLLLLAIPIVVFVNTTGVLHRVAATNRDKGTAIAEEGIAYAQQLLSTSQANWNNYLAGGAFPVECVAPNTLCTAGKNVTGPDGGQFLLTCNINDLRRQPYEVYVKSTACMLGPEGLKPTRAIEAFFGQKTVVATLPTGLAVPAALALGQAPTTAGANSLEVEFGPIACWDPAATWNLNALLDTQRRPRKFTVNSITGTPALRPGANGTTGVSDLKEYWTYSLKPNGTNPVINLDAYIAAAQNTTCSALTPPHCTPQGDCAPYAGPAPHVVDNCDYSNVGADTAKFGDTGAFNFTCPVAPNLCAIYVNGNATLDQINMNVGTTQMAFIVDGAHLLAPPLLTLANNGENPVAQYNLARIPPTASLDDPYKTCVLPTCQGKPTTLTDMYGFIYTNGNLSVAPTVATTWTINGVMRVDGTTALNANATLLIYYNDIVNYDIQTSDCQLMIDAQSEVTAQ